MVTSFRSSLVNYPLKSRFMRINFNQDDTTLNLRQPVNRGPVNQGMDNQGSTVRMVVLRKVDEFKHDTV